MTTFKPSDLFANGEKGDWVDFNIAQCFQDEAGTIPADIGDPVMSWRMPGGPLQSHPPETMRAIRQHAIGVTLGLDEELEKRHLDVEGKF